MEIINNKYFMQNPTVGNLRKMGFRYNPMKSCYEYKCYEYKFTIDDYIGKPSLICVFRTYLDVIDSVNVSETTIDLYNIDFSAFAAWYQKDNPMYDYAKDYLININKKIQKEMDKLGIINKN